MAVEIAMAAMGIPPGTSRSPAGFFGTLAERYRVGFFASRESRVWGMNASSIDELEETIFKEYSIIDDSMV